MIRTLSTALLLYSPTYIQQHIVRVMTDVLICTAHAVIMSLMTMADHSIVHRTLAYLNHNNFVGTASKYGSDNYMVNVKFTLWRNFCDSLL